MIVHVFNSSIVSGPEMLVLPALTKLTEQVTIIFLSETRLLEESKRPIEYAKKLGHQVISIPVQGRWDKTAFFKLREALDRLQPRVVHAHDVKASVFLYQAKKRRKGFKAALISTHHGASYRKGKIRLYEEYYVRRVLPHFDTVCSVCEEDRASIIRRGVDARKVVVHFNGVDRTPVHQENKLSTRNHIRSLWKTKMPDLPDPDGAYFLGAVARLSPEKRHDRMMHVLSHLPEVRGKKAVLLCFGSGAEEKRLKNLALQLRVNDRVFWMGYSDTIGNEMAGFDTVLCLSDGEGIPINLLEAGWAGTPVMATNVGGIPDLISTPDVGYLVQREDEDAEIAGRLRHMIYEQEALEQMGTAFQTRVMEKFSQKSWLKNLNLIYQNTLPHTVTH